MRLAQVVVRAWPSFSTRRVRTLDIEDGASGLSWDTGADDFEKNGPADMVAQLPAIKAQIETYRTRILSGEFKVYDALTEPLWDSLK
jgi:basic membrane protein A